MLLSPRKNGLTSLFKEVRVFKVRLPCLQLSFAAILLTSGACLLTVGAPLLAMGKCVSEAPQLTVTRGAQL